MPDLSSRNKVKNIEWLTLFLFFIVYLGWFLFILNHANLNIIILIIALCFLVVLHASLQHEVIHGHPTPWTKINHSLTFLSLGLLVPFKLFKETHLLHHRNRYLTDPYDDPESYFLSHKDWLKCNSFVKTILKLNNYLLVRIIFGPSIMIVRMIKTEYQKSKENPEIKKVWIQHLISVSLIISILWVSGFPILLYLFGIAYPASSILMLRSYIEHTPEQNIKDRSAIIKSNWIMQLLYLNNNFHRVHHDYPDVAWYNLPKLYQEKYLTDSKHVYSGYFYLFKRYAFKQHFPVKHPFLSKD